MHSKSNYDLRIGDLVASAPIIQGGMGVRVSRANLAAAVANQGCIGIIATAGIGQFETGKQRDYAALNADALREEIAKARKLSPKGIIGVNVLVALTDYESLVQTAIEEDIDVVISGAGLPLDLPKFLNGKKTKLIPIVSSAKALQLICRRWKKRYNKLPDAVIAEGPKAGGHLGYSFDDMENDTAAPLEKTLSEVLTLANSFETKIPVIAAGGIYDGNDIADMLKRGASGVQMATRFVCTNECDAHENFKQAYLDASVRDVGIIHSPVGLPGRVINSEFVNQINRGETKPFECKYHCLRTCDPKNAPFCIAKVLAEAAAGKLDDAFVFAGSNAYRCNEIVSVETLVNQLKSELNEAMKSTETLTP